MLLGGVGKINNNNQGLIVVPVPGGTRAGPALRVRELRTLADVLAAREPWTDLVGRVPSATPFQTWEWVSGFAQYDECPPRVLVLEEPSGRWVGVAPLCDHGSTLPGIRQLELIGGRLSDYPGPLIQADYQSSAEIAIRAWLERLGGRSVAFIRSQREVPARWLPALPFKVVGSEETIFVPLPQDTEQLMKSLSTKFRTNLRRNLRRLETEKAEFHTPANETELRSAMPALFHLHQLRKNSQGERGRFFEPRWCEAITEIAVALQKRAVTNLTVLAINGTPAAASFDFRLNRTQYTYQYGMNPEMRAFSPGKLLTFRMLTDAIAAGMTGYDFGRGLEEYKLQWSKDRGVVSDLMMTRNSATLAAVTHIHAGYGRLLRSRTLKNIYLTLRGRKKPPVERSEPDEA